MIRLAKSPRLSGTDRRRKRAQRMRLQAGLCHWCNGYMREDVPENHPHRAKLDHIIPLAAGGTNAMANLVASCGGCASARARALRQRRPHAIKSTGEFA